MKPEIRDRLGQVAYEAAFPKEHFGEPIPWEELKPSQHEPYCVIAEAVALYLSDMVISPLQQLAQAFTDRPLIVTFGEIMPDCWPKQDAQTMPLPDTEETEQGGEPC